MKALEHGQILVRFVALCTELCKVVVKTMLKS